LGYGASLILAALLEARLEPYNVKLSALDSEEPFEGLRNPTSSRSPYHDVSQSLLIDSILTIVQNYYVDAKRTSSRDLLDRALYALTENDDIRLHTLDEHRFRIETGEGETLIELDGDYDYEDLVGHASEIATLLESDGTTVATADHSAASQGRDGAFVFLNALLHSLDPHSTMLNREEYRDLRQGTEGTFGGLGVVVGMQDDLLTVIKPLPSSPASKAGISQADQIMSINNVATFGSTLDDLVHHMRGAPGTTVNLSLLREGAYAPFEISLKREIIQVASIETTLRTTAGGHRLLHLEVDSFSSRTAQEISQAILQHHREQPLAGIILDLRSNPGGLLDQAVQVSDLFLSSGDIVSTVGRQREIEKAYQDVRDIKLPLTVLINKDTASASEIVAGALQDNNRALIIGQPSFGKGSVQTVFELPSEQALKLTIARYYTPRGRSIQSIGIMPDIWLQPVLKNSANKNLLGGERYRNESFLNHAMNPDTSHYNPEKQGFSPYKGYYLAEDYEDRDQIRHFAEQLFDDLIDKNDLPVPAERLRASYWLANSHQLLQRLIERDSKKVSKYLSHQHKVNWRRTAVHEATNRDLVLTTTLADTVEVTEGGELEIPWSLQNRSNQAVERVSLFALPDNLYLETTERLVGKIGSRETIEGRLVIPVPISSMHESFRLTLGLARDSWPRRNSLIFKKVKIKPRAHPSLSYQVQLKDEEGGQQDGVLEPGEGAVLEVLVQNHSDIPARAVQANMVNLTGKQVALQSDGSKEFQLEPGAQKTMRIPLLAADRISQDRLFFGVSIGSEDLLQPVKGSFIVESQPGHKAASR
jgi:carboxyl-terminal processing protease